MKELMKRSLMLAAIMIFVVFSISYFSFGATAQIMIVFHLLFLSIVINLIQLLIKRALFGNFLLNMVTEYFAVSGFVLLYGCFVQWFQKNNWWMVFLYVALVYVPAYFLDMVVVKKEIDYINSRLEEKRRNEGKMQK